MHLVVLPNSRIKESSNKHACNLIDADDLTPELAAIEGINWLCFGEASNYVLQYRKCDVCMLTRTRALSSFIALLSSIFAKYNDWSERVLTLSLRSDGIRALFNSGAITDIMKNPVLMQNGDGSFGIFCGTLPVDFDNPSWKQLLDGGVLQDAQTMGSLSERRIRDSLKEPFIIEKTKKYNFLATNALLDGKFQGRLNYCDSERSFTPGFMALANYLNDIFSDVIARDLQRGVVDQDKNNMFVELLNVWHSDKNGSTITYGKLGGRVCSQCAWSFPFCLIRHVWTSISSVLFEIVLPCFSPMSLLWDTVKRSSPL